MASALAEAGIDAIEVKGSVHTKTKALDQMQEVGRGGLGHAMVKPWLGEARRWHRTIPCPATHLVAFPIYTRLICSPWAGIALPYMFPSAGRMTDSGREMLTAVIAAAAAAWL